MLNLGCLHPVAYPGDEGVFIASTQRSYRTFFTIYYYLNCYMFRSCDHLRAKIHLLGFTRLTTDPLFLEYR
jgi:hypothetical protein